MDMCRKFLEMGFTRARRYTNHRDGRKYDKNRNIILQRRRIWFLIRQNLFLMLRCTEIYVHKTNTTYNLEKNGD